MTPHRFDRGRRRQERPADNPGGRLDIMNDQLSIFEEVAFVGLVILCLPIAVATMGICYIVIYFTDFRWRGLHTG
eukprot:scaffold3058_cov165-Ochromonas_danica.AAC.8